MTGDSNGPVYGGMTPCGEALLTPFCIAFRAERWDEVRRILLGKLDLNKPLITMTLCLSFPIPEDIIDSMVELGKLEHFYKVFFLAARHGQAYIVQALLKKGVNVHNTYDNRTALDLTSSPKVARVLVEAGANIHWNHTPQYNKRMNLIAYLLSVSAQESIDRTVAPIHPEYYPLFERARYFVILMSPFHVARIGKKSPLRTLPEVIVRLLAGFLYKPVVESTHT